MSSTIEYQSTSEGSIGKRGDEIQAGAPCGNDFKIPFSDHYEFLLKPA